MKNVILTFPLICFFILTNLMSQTQLLTAPTFPVEVEQYESHFYQLQIKAQYINPFDVNDIKIDMLINTPSGYEIVQPCFFNDEQNDVSFWGLRFTPVEIGNYSYQIKIQTQRDTILTKTFSFKVITSERNGFLRLNPESDFTFKFDSGKLFRAFGENVCWTDDYEYYFKKLNEIGCNFTRIWMCPWNLYLEWKEPGLGKYHLQNAARLDSVLFLALKYNIFTMLCFDYHGTVQKEQGYFQEKKWDENPYNQKNGGPCQTEADFFSNQIAKRYYKNRLNYIVARYSYSPHILAWEFWNEVDLTAGKPEDIIAWHKEMAAYLRHIDPYKHLITTSFSYMEYPEIWQNQNIDITQTHLYNKPNYAALIPVTLDKHQLEYNKPHIIGEFGSDYRGSKETRENDPENGAIHNGLWAGLFSPTPILPLTWWWDELIEADNLYFHFQAITNFAKEISISSKPIEKLDIEDILIDYNSSKPIDSYSIHPFKPWGKNTISSFHIDSDGQVNNKDQIPSYLYGKSKLDMKRPPEFKLNYQSDGGFSVHVGEVSDFGVIKIYLDGNLALEKPLPLGEGDGEWEKSTWKEELKMYQGVYNKQYSINVPPGNHTIRVENDGQDWIKITLYQFENCCVNKGDKIKILGVRQSPYIFLWLRNEKSQWQLLKHNKIQILPEIKYTLTIPDLKVGTYHVEWWDTYQGNIFQSQNVSVTQDDEIKLNIPGFNKDIACKIYRKFSK